MLSSLFDSVLPGVRDIRTPLVTGLLWLLLIWLTVAQSVPPQGHATGFVRQVFELSAKGGPSLTVGAVAIVAYMVGVLGVTFAALLKLGVGTLRDALPKSLQGMSGQASPVKLTREIALNAVAHAMAKGFHDESRRVNETHGLSMPNFYDMADRRAEQLVVSELGEDPIDVLHAYEPSLFQSLDRERSEQEFRTSAMVPTFALGVHGALVVSPWSYIIVVLAGFTFLRSTWHQQSDSPRVLRQLLAKHDEFPSLRYAEMEGRSEFFRRLGLASKKVKEQAGRERRDTLNAALEADEHDQDH